MDIQGTGGADTLTGTSGDDIIHGGDGSDTIDGGLGADKLYGDDGNDTILFSAISFSNPAPTAIGIIDGGAGYDTLDLSRVTPTTVGSIQDTSGNIVFGISVGSQKFSVIGIENIILGASSDYVNLIEAPMGVTVHGGDGNDDFFSVTGASIYGEGGNDDIYISGVFGSTSIGLVDGGSGLNTLHTNIGFTVDLTAGTASAGGASFVIRNIQNVIATTDGYLSTVSGDDDANVLSVGSFEDDGRAGVIFYGRGGNDTLSGSAGSDYLDGGAGDDLLSGGAGDDYLDGGPGNDTASYASATSGVTVNLGLTTAQNTGGAGTDTLRNIENLTGSSYDDTLTGDDGDNLLNGGSGNDTLVGGAGNDTLVGGDGNDLLIGGPGNNVVDGGAGTDTLALAGSRSSYSVLQDGNLIFVIGLGEADQISNIETVRFADGQASLGEVLATAPRFDPLEYAASNPDLIAAFGDNPMALEKHYVDYGFKEGRSTTSFDPLEYAASNPDLIAAFGDNPAALEKHYVDYGFKEGRSTNSFDPLEYAASNPDLIAAFGDNPAALEKHYVDYGFKEGRSTTSFDPLEYAASNPDLIAAFGDNPAALEKHYVDYGFKEGRSTNSFDPLEYAASNPDLIAAFGDNPAALEKHYVDYGFKEGRSTTSFDPLEYAASNPDLIAAFGDNPAALEKHYVDYGFKEGRPTTSFDAVGYLLSYPDLEAAGLGAAGALQHWVTYGEKENRIGDALFGHDQTSHGLALGTPVSSTIDWSGDHDWFQVTLSANQVEEVDLAVQSGSALQNPFLQVFDSAGHLLSSATGNSAASLHFTSPAAGTYYIAVSSTAPTSTGTYTVGLSPR